MLTAADLTFDAERHVSVAPDGRQVPHVTTILSATGLSTDWDEMARNVRKIGQHVAFASARGTAVHADCHALDDDDLDWGAVDYRVRPYVQAWERLKADKGLTPIAHARERLLFHPGLWYAGILDGVFLQGEGRRILIDIKTGDPEDSACHLQTAAYEMAWTLEHPDEPIAERWGVRLAPEMRVPYRIKDYTTRPEGFRDMAKWQAALCVYWEQPERRGRSAA